MLRLLKADNGMTIFGQGPRIMLFAAPWLAAAIAAGVLVPDSVRLPLPAIVVPLGVVLMLVGAVYWLTALVQLLTQFPRGRLVTTGAYGVCRNPIYGSFACFVLPGLALATRTWGYLVAAAAVCLGVSIFIGAEERDLLRVFGDEYRRYTLRVRRLVPLWKP